MEIKQNTEIVTSNEVTFARYLSFVFVNWWNLKKKNLYPKVQDHGNHAIATK